MDTWDPLLFAGSAAYYARGRFAYPDELAHALTEALHLDGTGRLLDVGCGPGSLTLLLAHNFGEVVGLDPDVDMINEAARLAEVPNARWVCLRAEDLPADLGTFRLVTFAQSFHWMDRPRVAASVFEMLEPGGACAHVHATTHRGTDVARLPNPRPPHAAITELIQRYLGPERRAGSRILPNGTPGGEHEIYLAAGFDGPRRITVAGRILTRDVDDVVATVFSLSGSAPHLFGDRLAAFEADLRELLQNASSTGVFGEQAPEVAVDIYDKPLHSAKSSAGTVS